MLDLRRLKPTALTVAGLVAFVWVASHGAARDFVWADLREGMMSTHGLSRGTRSLVRLAFLLLGVMVAALIFNDLWRAQSELIVIGVSSVARGQLVPVALLPLTLFMMAAAWSFGLAGALHSHRAVRLVVLALYLLTALGWIQSHVAGDRAAPIEKWAMLAALAGVPLLYALRWRAHARPVLEFPLLFLFVAALFWLAQRQELAGEAIYGVPVGLAKLNLNVVYLTGLVTPILMLVGLDIAGFTLHAAEWTQEIIASKTPALVLRLAFVGLLGWRLWVAVQELIDYAANPTANGAALAYAGGLGEVMLAALLCYVVRRLARGAHALSRGGLEEAAEGYGFPLILVFSLPALLVFVLAAAGIALPMKGPLAPVQQAIFPLTDFITAYGFKYWYYFLCGAALVAAVPLARRGHPNLAQYVGLVGLLSTWGFLTRPEGVLSFLTWRTEQPMEFWWLAVIAAATAWVLLRGRLNLLQVGRLFFLLMVLTLMRQRNFIENPFSAFFGFAGVVFMAFALVWDMTTHGSWANESTAALPRTSRIFLYLGYMLLAATVLNWAVTTHDLAAVQKLTGGTSLLGFDRFGKPFIYAVFFLTLRKVTLGEEEPEPAAAEEE
jgi:hypothetical protein